MASAIAHFIVGAALALPAIESRTIREVLPRWAIPISCGALAVAPDLDTIAMRAFGIPYGSFFGHRGFFHSPFFLILLAGSLAAMAAGRRSSRATVWLGLLWAGCAVTHPLLDALTDGGSGVMLLFPFSDVRLFFPWRPIHVSPLGVLRRSENRRVLSRSVTHPLLDALTDGGSGVMLLFPFSDVRLFFPWRPIHVSPLGVLRFFSRAGYILRSEMPFCIAAMAIGAAGCWLVHAARGRRGPEQS